jgi:hypothetical protein
LDISTGHSAIVYAKDNTTNEVRTETKQLVHTSSALRHGFLVSLLQELGPADPRNFRNTKHNFSQLRFLLILAFRCIGFSACLPGRQRYEDCYLEFVWWFFGRFGGEDRRFGMCGRRTAESEGKARKMGEECVTL